MTEIIGRSAGCNTVDLKLKDYPSVPLVNPRCVK